MAAPLTTPELLALESKCRDWLGEVVRNNCGLLFVHEEAFEAAVERLANEIENDPGPFRIG